jgi:predicted methyltransferase
MSGAAGPGAEGGSTGKEWDDISSAAYVDSVFYAKDSPAQKRHLQLCLQALKFEPEHRFVDVGAGNGDFTAIVRNAAGLEKQALGVEPAASMVSLHTEDGAGEAAAKEAGPVSLLTSPAVDFVELTALAGDAAIAWQVSSRFADVRGFVPRGVIGGAHALC